MTGRVPTILRRVGVLAGFLMPLGCSGGGQASPPPTGADAAISDLQRPSSADFAIPPPPRARFRSTGPWKPLVEGAAYPVIADFDRDGRPDVAFGACSTIEIRLTGPGGTPGPAVVFTVSDQECRLEVGLVAGDFNRDGIIDLAVRTGDPALAPPSNFAVWLGVGDGSFRPPAKVLNLPRMNDIPGLLEGDLDGNGTPDLLVITQPAGNGSDPRTFSALLGHGDGTFLPVGMPLSLPVSFGGARLGDLNRDGHLDLLAFQASPPEVFPMLGDGAGNFRAGPNTFFPGDLGGQLLADFDKDGVPDLTLADRASHVGLARGLGAGGFAPPRLFSISEDPADSVAALRAADFDGDGWIDVIGSSYNDHPERGIQIFYGAPGLTLAGPERVGDLMTPGVLEIADFNQDGRPDLLLLDPQDGFGIYLNLGP